MTQEPLAPHKLYNCLLFVYCHFLQNLLKALYILIIHVNPKSVYLAIIINHWLWSVQYICRRHFKLTSTVIPCSLKSTAKPQNTKLKSRVGQENSEPLPFESVHEKWSTIRRMSWLKFFSDFFAPILLMYFYHMIIIISFSFRFHCLLLFYST